MGGKIKMPLSKPITGSVVESSTNSEPMYQEYLNEDDFVKASTETIYGVVSELLDRTAKNVAIEEAMHSPSTPRNKGKQKSACEVSSSDSKELPVRRSSRIQSKTVKKDEVVKKKRNPKTDDTNLIDVISVDEETAVKDVIEKNQTTIDIIVNQTTASKTESENNIKKNKEVTPKQPKTPKRSQKKTDKKEDMKSNEKLKPERKKTTSRKRKQEVADSDNELDKIRIENDKTNSNGYKTIVKENTVSSSQITRTSFNKTTKSTIVETKTADVSKSISKSDDDKNHENSDTNSESNIKPVKVKSRWWRSSELEGVLNTETSPTSLMQAETTPSSVPTSVTIEDISVCATEEAKPLDIKSESEKEANSLPNDCGVENISPNDNTVISFPEQTEQPSYEHIEENIYRFERKKSKSKKQVRRMICDCTLTKEEQECGVLGCKEECLNRLLMIECGYRCPIGDACSNKKFQKKEYMKAEIFKAEKKGWGLRALEPVSSGDFLMEFVGEVLNHKEYRQRVKQYARDKNVHCYFMALKTDEILDATSKGNFTRFINHSCDPNCETQKWTVNGELRVGVFAKRSVSVGEEFTLDYQFQRYGREAQKCYCGSYNCSGYIGENKQISIDAYSASKTSSSKRKKISEEKKRDWEDMTLEEEIEKLNSFKGLRNREETLKFARLMVRADDNATRHQLLDLILKTEEQACLRLFLDYHGLPLLWSWMTDIVDLGLKSKILQVLQLLPIPNKTMLLDSKVMSIVEKWVQECDVVKKECDNSKDVLSDISSDANLEFLAKKLKFPDFSDSETDSSGSQHAIENSENKSSVTENNDCKTEFSPSDIPLPDTASENKADIQCSKLDSSLEITNSLKKDISSVGSELLCTWKNLKEIFRIPRLEQQKRKEDEREADHGVLSRIQTEIKKPEVEVTGNQIQVLISGITTDNMKNFDYDNPDINYKHEHRSRKGLPKPPSSNKQIRRTDEEVQQSLNEDSSVNTESSILSSGIANSTIPQHTTRPALLPIPTYLNQPPVNFPPPIIPSTAQPPPIKSTPPTIYPPQIIYPQPPQVNFLSTSIPPPTISHPPTNMPPPTAILPKQHPPPLLQQPPPSIPPPIQPINPCLPPISTNYILPPNVPPATVVPQFIPNPTTPVSNYPPAPNAFGNQNQSYYYLPQPPAISNSTTEVSFSENVPIQSVATIPMQPVTTTSIPMNPLPLPGANPIQTATVNSCQLPSTNMLPVQSINPLPLQPTIPVQEVVASPIVEDTKPIKLPKNWRSATDPEGNTYYYHSVTRQTQWDPPEVNQNEDSEDEEEDSVSGESESSDTPIYDEPKISSKHSKRKSKKKKTTKAAADTSVSFPVRPEIAKKIKELFRTKMSTFIVQCLNHYRKPECKVGRITSNEDFKYLARKLTHYIMTKEIKQLKNVEDLDCNETVTHKAKDFIKKYMSKYGSKYNRKEKCSPS